MCEWGERVVWVGVMAGKTGWPAGDLNKRGETKVNGLAGARHPVSTILGWRLLPRAAAFGREVNGEGEKGGNGRNSRLISLLAHSDKFLRIQG